MKTTGQAKPVTIQKKDERTRACEGFGNALKAVSVVMASLFVFSYAKPVLRWAVDRITASKFVPTAAQAQALESCDFLKTQGLPVTLGTFFKQYEHDTGGLVPITAVPNIGGELKGACIDMYVPPKRPLSDYVDEYNQVGRYQRSVAVGIK